jgi:hypothetical protein
MIAKNPLAKNWGDPAVPMILRRDPQSAEFNAVLARTVRSVEVDVTADAMHPVRMPSIA